MENYDWCQNAVFAEDIALRTYFGSQKDYYFGDPNSANFGDFDDPKWHLPLPDLSFNPSKNDWVDAKKIVGNEEEFGNYYKFLIEKAYEYGHSFNTIRHYFWMRSSFVSESKKISVGFPWYDTHSEFSNMYNWIAKGNNGDVFSDTEQGWQLNGIIKDDKVYFLETDDSSYPVNIETSEIFNNVCMELGRLRKFLEKNEFLVQDLIKKLTAEIGIDVWTTYHYEDNLNFGTNVWKPKNPSASKSIFKRLFKK